MFPRSSAPASSSTHSHLIGASRIGWTFSLTFGIALAACSGDATEPGNGTGGTVGFGGSAGSAGMVGTAGSSAGTTSTSGASGAATTGGAAAAGAGTTGGAAAGGAGTTGGMAAGGSGAAPGGTTGGGGAGGAMAGSGGGGSSSGGSSSGGSGSGTCQKGTTMGKEVLFIGESFVAASSIPEETTKLARAAGSLTANDSYVDKSVSGTWIGNGASNSIPNQYKDNSSGVRFVLMNGGGNDCWQGGGESHRTAALSAAEKLFQDMGTKGVKKVVYFFYPDPIGSQYANLTACLDLLRPAMKTLCDKQTSPQCHWVDLRETWNGHPEYTMDGIHVAGPGNAPTAKAIFDSMVANCVAP